MRRSILVGLLLAAVAAVTVVGAVVVVSSPGASDGFEPEPDPEFDEFDPDTVVTDPLSAEGRIEPDAAAGDGEGVVLIDNSHGNRFDRAKTSPMVEALGRAGYETRVHALGDLNESLEDADAFVIIDPSTEFDEEELDAIEQFIDQGGRVVAFGEPNRIEVTVDLFGASLDTQESAFRTFSGRFGIYFEPRFVYDQEVNDGNYRHVVASATDDAALPPSEENGSVDVEDIALYTATEVRATDGRAVLETAPTARTVESDVSRRHTVAVRDGNILAVGDSTFLRSGRHNVGDNDVFLGHVVEFLISGDRDTTRDIVVQEEDDDAEDGADTGAGSPEAGPNL